MPIEALLKFDMAAKAPSSRVQDCKWVKIAVQVQYICCTLQREGVHAAVIGAFVVQLWS